MSKFTSLPTPSLSPSAIAVQAMGYPLPDLPVAQEDGVCGLCGIPIRKGLTPVREFVPSPEFGAHKHLNPTRSGWICAPCAVVTSGASGFTTRFTRALFTPSKAYRLSSADDVAWMLMQAEPPFVAIFNTRSSAHMVWHAPVSYSRHEFGIVLGSISASIRPDAVLAAHAALSRLCEVSNHALHSHYQWPVFNLRMYDDLVDICRLIPTHERVLRDCKEPSVVADLRAFDNLNQAERWALSALLLAKPKRGGVLGPFEQPPILDQTSPVAAEAN